MIEATARPKPSNASKMLVAGLFVTSAGITIQFFSGMPGFPVVPPGTFITAGAALVVLLLPWRWAPAIGLGTTVFVLGGAITASVVRDGEPLAPLTNPSVFGQFAGVALQWIGMLVALVAGIAAVRHAAVRSLPPQA